MLAHSGYGPQADCTSNEAIFPDGTVIWYQNHRPAMNAGEDIGDLFYICQKFYFKTDSRKVFCLNV